MEKLMQAVQIHQYGTANELRLGDVPEPDSDQDFAKVRVKAFGLNQVERYVREGRYGKFPLPHILGVEAVGEIVEDKTGTFEVGDRVVTAMGGLMLSRDGSYAEYILAPPSNLHRTTSVLSWDELASLPLAYFTAISILDNLLNIEAGETLLVRGGTSSLGIACLLYAKARGLKVVTTTRSPANVSTLERWGADFVAIDNENVAPAVRAGYGEGVDKAVELVGSKTIADTLACIRPWGEGVIAGLLGGSTIVDNFDLMGDIPNTVKLSYFGSGILGTPSLPLPRQAFDEVIQWREQNRIPSFVSRVFPFAEIAKAHEQLDKNSNIGKIVVAIP